ncbi:MAG: glycosyltransferase family 2 protein [Fidelibacterota bacterium]
MEDFKDISVVIPLYNESQSLQELADEVVKVLESTGRSYEVLFIDDGSTDSSFSILNQLVRRYPFISALRFRKNYGKSAALSEGFKRTKGRVVVTMDADLQDDPHEIPRLINKLQEGYDLVSGWKKRRRDPLTKRLPSKIFNFVTSLLTGLRIHDFNCGLKAYRSEVVKSIRVYGELHRYIPALASWEGFNVGELPVSHRPRKYGGSKYGLSRFFSGFFDLFTVLFLGRYMRRPLHFFGIPGFLLLFAGLVINIYLSILWFSGTWIGRRPLLFLGILLMIVGVQFISLGLLGEMITHTRGKSEEYGIDEVL